jgi:outer membrane biosynthesis protein TonB
MATNYIGPSLVAALLGLLLAGCGKAPEPEAPAPATPAEAPAPPAEAVPAPSGEVPPVDAAEPAPSPAPAPPPPTEPSAVPKPTAAEPALDSMPVATASAKISVPVNLRYQIDGDALSGQPFTLHLAAIPRVAGAQLQVSVKSAPGLQIASDPLQIQKARAATPYRQRLSVTRSVSGPENLRVLVTMDLAEGTAFGYFTIPLASGITAQKPDSVKQH